MMHKHKTHVQSAGANRPRKSAEETVAEIITRLFADARGPIVIAVGGPGGTGKTSFCARLERLLPDCAVLHLDNYKTPRRQRSEQNLFGAHPRANRIDLLRTHLQRIRQGESIDTPVYETVSGRAAECVRFAPARFTLLDGEIATYPHVREFVDFSVFIDADWRTQLATRISRDIEQRGYSREKAIATFLQSNLREFAEFGADSKAWADIHLHCREDYHLILESLSEDLYRRFGPTLWTELKPVDLAGLIVAVCSPFDAGDQFDTTAFIGHLEYLADAGVKKTLINGTTGEFFSLRVEERRLALKLARRYFPGLIIYHAGRASLAETLDEARLGEDYGADAIAALTPYYFANAPERGLAAYFGALADALDTPLILYNFPRHTGNAITPTLLDTIPHFGLKDSSGDLSLIGHTPHYFIGGDSRISEAYAAGGAGFVSGHANYAPRLYVAFEQALGADPRTARSLQEEITALSVTLSGPAHIAAIKQALSTRIPGYPARVRPPLAGIDAAHAAELLRIPRYFS